MCIWTSLLQWLQAPAFTLCARRAIPHCPWTVRRGTCGLARVRRACRPHLSALLASRYCAVTKRVYQRSACCGGLQAQEGPAVSCAAPRCASDMHASAHEKPDLVSQRLRRIHGPDGPLCRTIQNINCSETPSPACHGSYSCKHLGRSPSGSSKPFPGAWRVKRW